MAFGFFKDLFLRLTTIFLILVWFFSLNQGFFVFAQEDDPAALRLKRDELQKELEEIQSQISRVQSETKTLQRDISRLNLEIKELNIGIRQADLTIKELALVIKEKEAALEEIKDNILKKRAGIGAALRQIYEFDQISSIEILIAYGSLSGFFENLETFRNLHGSIYGSLNEVKKLKEDEQINLENLEKDLTEEYRVKKIQQMDLAGVKEKEVEKKVVVSSKKGEEAALKVRLEEVRTALSELQRYFTSLVLKGVMVSQEDIIKFAKEAAAITGVRPAYLLAVLEVESKLGENIGKGDWQKDMKPDQREAFLAITRKLGLDPNDVPVSKKPYYGWGGAMGPAQFLPKTWLGYEAEIASLTGSNPPNPWDMRDAIFAMALYLARRGADDPSREQAASRAYISGRTDCYSFICSSYANQIKRRTAVWQEYLK